jgi:hypothetical protein
MEVQLIKLLADSFITPQTIARLCKVEESDVWDVLERENESLGQIEKDYYEHEYPKVQKRVQEQINDTPVSQRNDMRARYLKGEIEKKKMRFLETNDPTLRKELAALLLEAKIYTGEVKGFSPAEVARARLFPIERLIKHRNFMAICPFHKESSPSLNIKNNFYYCHGCGATGDVIDFVMKKDNLTFNQAIMKLHP